VSKKTQDNKTQGDFAFPKEWTLFGPVGKDDPEPDFEEMKDIPKELIVAGNRLVGKNGMFEDNRLDLGALLGGSAQGITAYAVATIEADKDTEIELGAGADWWMKWWVNGEVVFDTLATGNGSHPPSVSDHRFTARLRAGRNLIAIKVVNGGGSFALAAGGPREMRDEPECARRWRERQEKMELKRARAREESWRAEFAAAKRAQEARDKELLGGAPRPVAPGVRPGEADYRAVASHADLVYDRPVKRSEEGMPIGTGSMGSLVWTTPTAIRMQVNRVDVFASNKDTRSFSDSQEDYCNGCSYVDIDLVDFGEDVFTEPAFRQHLSVYDGVVSLAGKGVSARAVASQRQDVFAIEIEDRRERPSAVGVDLRMLRYAIRFIGEANWDLTRRHAVQIVTGHHTATSRLEIRGDRIVLTQEFREGDYYCASAVIAAVAGRPATAKYASESSVRLSAAPGNGKFTILVASAASFDPKEDVTAKAMATLDGTGADFAAVHAANELFWQDFWSRAFIRLKSADGRAEFVERNYTYFLYLTASCSRGAFPPKFNGMLWVTTGDMRLWGACYWWDNMSPHCRPLPAMNRPELLAPFFRMYGGMAESCALAARQQWGSQGLYYPITIHFDGMGELPEDVAEEMRDLYLLRKPWEQRSRRFMEYAEDRFASEARWNWKEHLPHSSYLAGVRTKRGFGADYPKYLTARRTDDGWTFTDLGSGPFGHVTHAFGGAAEMALVYWKHYEHTQDRDWLREVGYPIIKGVLEFYRNFPNMRKGDDGRYHLHGLTGGESLSGAQDDAVIDIAALHTVTPILIRAAEILGADPGLLPVWREFRDHLPTLQDAMESRHDGYDDLLYTEACWDFTYVETEDTGWMRRGNATLNRVYPDGTSIPGRDDACTRVAIAAAHLGRAEDWRNVILNQCRPAHHNLCGDTGSTDLLPNHMSWRSGAGAPDAEHLGFAAEALQEALLQSGPPAPGKEPIIHVFPAWPKDWEAEFTLGARGGFLVTSAMRGGKVPFVELQAVADLECCLRNPWGEAAVALTRDGKPAGELSGGLLRFPMKKGEVAALAPRNEAR